MRKFILALSMLLATNHGVCANEWNIVQLTELLAHSGAAKARFTEEKTIAALDAPIQSSGELVYIPPDVIEKNTITPKPERMRLEGNTITLERGKRKYSLSLDESPEITALTESIRATLTGDRHALELHYYIALHGVREQWKMQLTPRNPKARQTIEHITVEGRSARIEKITVAQADGDSSTMRIEPISP